MSKRTMVRWASVLILAAAACAARRQTEEATFHDPTMDFSLVRNVAVLPFENLTATPAAAERVRNVFMTMMQATGAAYVLPPGEVARGISRLSLRSPDAPTAEEIVQFAKVVDADVVITGTVLEYGELRSAGSAANVISTSVKTPLPATKWSRPFFGRSPAGRG